MTENEKKEILAHIAAELSQVYECILDLDRWVYKNGTSRAWIDFEPKAHAAQESILQIAIYLHDLGIEDKYLERWTDEGVFGEKLKDEG